MKYFQTNIYILIYDLSLLYVYLFFNIQNQNYINCIVFFTDEKMRCGNHFGVSDRCEFIEREFTNK